MTSVTTRMWTTAALVSVAVVLGTAQQKPADPKDPRVGLKPGVKDAGVAARHMELVSNLGRPDGFFDPKAPAGDLIPPERPQGTEGAAAGATGVAPEAAPSASALRGTVRRGNGAPTGAADAAPAAGAAPTPPRGGGLDFANSDLAFAGTHMWVGNFHGFNTYDIENPRRPKLLASIACPGGQGDVSVYGNLLFMSVEQTRGRIDCGLQGNQETVSKERFRGVRIFDISDLKKPRQVAAVQTCRGSHTHTLVPVAGDKSRI